MNVQYNSFLELCEITQSAFWREGLCSFSGVRNSTFKILWDDLSMTPVQDNTIEERRNKNRLIAILLFLCQRVLFVSCVLVLHKLFNLNSNH